MRSILVLFAGLVGCGLDPLAAGTADTSGGVAEDGFHITPDVVAFGVIPPGSSDSISLTLINGTSEAIDLVDAQVSGGQGAFSIDVSTLPASLQADAEAVLTVTFSPPEEKEYLGNLAIMTGDAAVTIPLSGTGGIGGGDGSDDGGDDGGDDGSTGDPDGLSVDASSLSFGSVYTTANAQQQLTLTNNGIDDVLVTDLVLSDDSIFSWAPASGENFTLAQVISAGNSKTIALTFDPIDIGPVSETLTIQSQDNPDIVVSLTGEGTEPPCTVCTPTIAVDTGGSDSHMMNGFSSVFGLNSDLPLIIYNQSDVDLVISGYTLTNDTQGGTFSVVSGLSATTIGPRSSINATVRYSCPTICLDLPNIFTGENYLHIQSNDPAQPSYEIGLSTLPE